MKTLALASGDLVVGQSGHEVVRGASKIRQDLALALGEPYGTDRFHPTLGSVLPSYLGEPITQEIQSLVVTEVARVIQQYIDTQAAEVLRDGLSESRTRYETADVVSRVDSVDAHVDLDSIRVRVALTTLSGQSVSVTRTVNL